MRDRDRIREGRQTIAERDSQQASKAKTNDRPTASAIAPFQAAASGREPKYATSHNAIIRPRKCSGTRAWIWVLKLVRDHDIPSPETANPAIVVAGSRLTASINVPVASSNNPVVPRRGRPSQRRVHVMCCAQSSPCAECRMPKQTTQRGSHGCRDCLRSSETE